MPARCTCGFSAVEQLKVKSQSIGLFSPSGERHCVMVVTVADCLFVYLGVGGKWGGREELEGDHHCTGCYSRHSLTHNHRHHTSYSRYFLLSVNHIIHMHRYLPAISHMYVYIPRIISYVYIAPSHFMQLHTIQSSYNYLPPSHILPNKYLPIISYVCSNQIQSHTCSMA